ncbi:general substrate transporter [Hesseltinella vesiculosa]|uniref:General substrate transporter n=1 Tax=Hesseltinella vesiculosa TaxID=101127 RepID=A0A1X2G7B6_9FUNG|nr:general substrate transporter [Hesseltinella vesiculosa]
MTDMQEVENFEKKRVQVQEYPMLLRDVAPKLDKYWWHYPHLLKLNALLLGSVLVQTTTGYDGSLLNGLQSLTQWDSYFGNPTGPRLGTLSSGVTFGMLAIMIFTSWISDRFGRRWPIIVGSFVTIIGAIVQGAAVNFGMFWVGRFIIGVGLGALQVCAPMMLSETAYPTQRAVVTSIYEPSFPFGALIAAVVTYGTYQIPSTWAWRIPSLLQCFAAMLQIGFTSFCPESPRWLVHRGRVDEARAVLIKYHGGGDPNSPLVEFELREIVTALEQEKLKKASKWKEFVATKGNRHRLAIILFMPVITQLSGNQIVSYYLHLILNSINITDTKDQLTINTTLLVVELVAAVLVATYAEKIGRRRLFFIGILGMLGSFIIWTILSALAKEGNYTNPALSLGVLVMIYFYVIFYHVIGPIAPTYIMEISPFSFRAKASTIFQVMSQAIGLYNSFVNPIAMGAISWNYYIVFLCVLSVQVVFVYFYFPEVQGYSLEEVALIFDGDEAPGLGHVVREEGHE